MFRSSHSEPRHLKLFDQPCSLIRCTSSVATMKRWHQASAIYIEGIVFVIFAIFCEGFSFHPRDRRCPRRNLWPADTPYAQTPFKVIVRRVPLRIGYAAAPAPFGRIGPIAA